MGNGKSTTGNQLIRQILKLQKKKPKHTQQFEARKSMEAVTTKIDIKRFENISYIDSPGFNDPNKNRSDNQIFSDIVDTILQKAAKFGLASLLQCIMVP
jgi:GTPase Era involved in 16S rRNA processing